MNIVLVKSSHLGQAGDLLDVAPGYAFNFLIPRGFAKPATQDFISDFENKKKSFLDKEAELAVKSRAFIQSHGDLPIFVLRPSINTDGRLYGSISSVDVAKSINTSFHDSLSKIDSGYVVDKSRVDILTKGKKITSHGVYNISISLPGNVTWSASLVVSHDNASAAKIFDLQKGAPVKSSASAVNGDISGLPSSIDV